MAQEIAQMERGRVLYEKLKTQSDKFLTGLNIRLDKSRPRGSVVNNEEAASESSDGEHASGAAVALIRLKPCELQKLAMSRKSDKIVTLLFPCDWTEVKEESSRIRQELEATKSLLAKSASCLVECSLPVCVCGSCSEPEKKLSGPLRSILYLLKSTPAVSITRGGGLLGLWNSRDEPLVAFIRRNL
jgi:hypothetical protein